MPLKNILKKGQIAGRIRDIYEYSWLWYIVSSIKDAVWYPIIYRTPRRYHILDLRDGGNGYDIGWHDSDSQILQANFLILKNFVEKEKPFNHIDWDYDDEYRKLGQEIKDLYDWWTVERAKEHAALAAEWNKLDLSWHTEPTENGLYHRMVWTGDDTKDLHQREEELQEKDTEMLIRLMKIRRSLWTQALISDKEEVMYVTINRREIKGNFPKGTTR